MRTALAVVMLVIAALPASAHRLDEYLQGSLISIEKNRLNAEMTLTPGVAVYPFVISSIDLDGDGTISETEQRAYAAKVLHDLSLSIDDRHLTPHLTSLRFPTTNEMKEGRGEIHLNFSADLPEGGRTRKVTLENHHQSRISAYQVNCLLPQDPAIRIATQNRNYSQSLYALEYVQTNSLSIDSWSSRMGWPGALALLLFMRMGLLWRRRTPAIKSVEVTPL